MRISVAFALCLVFSFLTVLAQPDLPSFSPPGSLTQIIGDTRITIHYERPSARGRVIFGALVPWGEVWRTGAGSCTKISFSQPLKVGGQSVPAGTYSLFTIPMPGQWMIILNADTTLYGAYDYDPAQDVARFRVPSRRSERYYESLTIDLDLIPNDVRLYLSWTDVQLSFLIETGTDEELHHYISEELVDQTEAKSDVYAGAASYLLSQGREYFLALVLTEKALAADPESEFAHAVQVEVYEALGYNDKAQATAERALKLVKGKSFSSETDRNNTLGRWEQEIKRLQNSEE